MIDYTGSQPACEKPWVFRDRCRIPREGAFTISNEFFNVEAKEKYMAAGKLPPPCTQASETFTEKR
jgi:hypothetical protein